MTVRETVNATKERFGSGDLDTVFNGVTQVIVAKGKKQTTFHLGAKADHEPADFEKAVLGPTGNLRAPTVKVGKKALVGFQDEAWSTVFG